MKKKMKTLPASDTAGKDVPTPGVHPEIAVTWGAKDITRGYLLENQIAYTDDYILMQQGGNDLRAYTEILRDEQVKACFEQRRSAVVSAELLVEPGGDRAIDKLAADFLTAQLDKIGFNSVTDRMLYCTFYGFMAAEIIYEPGPQYLEWSNIKVRNPRRFSFLANGEMRLRTTNGGIDGEPADAPYFWHVSSGSEFDDQPYGKGLGHWCYWLVKLKRNALKYWMIYAEKFGMPTALAKFPALTTTDANKAALLSAAGSVSTDAGIMIPDNCTLELLSVAKSGGSDYKDMKSMFDDSIANAIIGQSLTSTKGASRAQGQVHFQVRQDIVASDSELICDSFNNGPVAWLISTNFPTAALPRVRRVIEEPEDLNALAEREQRLVSVGYRPTQKRVNETYGGGYEPVPEPAPQPVTPVNATDAQGLPGVSVKEQ